MSDEKENDLLSEIQEASYSTEVIEEEDDNDDYVEGKSLAGQSYELPSEADKFVDTAKGEVIDKTKLSDFDVIKAVAKQNNIEVRNPRSGCKKCYGRGFIGRDFATKQPIPCSCIQIPKTQNTKDDENMHDFKNNNKNQMTKKMIQKIKKLMKSEKQKYRAQKILENSRLADIDKTENDTIEETTKE